MSDQLLTLRAMNKSTRITPMVKPDEQGTDTGSIAGQYRCPEYPYTQDAVFIKYEIACADLENIILPHQLIIQLLQGPIKSEVKLRLLNMNLDKILTKMCRALFKTAAFVASKQRLIYKFILSLIPFLFEKVKSIPCSYLMLSQDELFTLIRSEQQNIIMHAYKSNQKSFEIITNLYNEADNYES